MFHGNAWQFPYVGPLLGWKLVWPGRAYDPASLTELLTEERCTIMSGVPTFWLMLLDHLEKTGTTLPHLRVSLSSGAPVRSQFPTGPKLQSFSPPLFGSPDDRDLKLVNGRAGRLFQHSQAGSPTP